MAVGEQRLGAGNHGIGRDAVPLEHRVGARLLQRVGLVCQLGRHHRDDAEPGLPRVFQLLQQRAPLLPAVLEDEEPSTRVGEDEVPLGPPGDAHHHAPAPPQGARNCPDERTRPGDHYSRSLHHCGRT